MQLEKYVEKINLENNINQEENQKNKSPRSPRSPKNKIRNSKHITINEDLTNRKIVMNSNNFSRQKSKSKSIVHSKYLSQSRNEVVSNLKKSDKARTKKKRVTYFSRQNIEKSKFKKFN